MPLNIKNPRALELAQLVSQVTGESLTQAVTVALEERLARLQGSRRSPDLVQEILAISERCSALPELDLRHPDEILGYDDVGGFGDGD